MVYRLFHTYFFSFRTKIVGISLGNCFFLLTCLSLIPLTGIAQDRNAYVVTGKVSGIRNMKKTEAFVIAYKVVRGESGKLQSLELIGPKYQSEVDEKGDFSLKLYGDTEYQLRCIATGYNPVPYPMKKKNVSEGQAIAITLDMEPSDSYLLKALFIDEVTRRPVSGVKANLTSLKDATTFGAYSNEKGICFFDLREGERYTLLGQKSRYFFNEADTFSVEKQKSQLLEKQFVLEEIKKGQIVRIEGHFDVNSHTITSEGAAELEKLFEILIENPDVQFELSSHCDSRGDDHYNLILSQKRAESAAQYLISKGISPTQLVPKGYGESRLLNKCSNGVRCPAGKHQENRRIELKVMGFLE